MSPRVKRLYRVIAEYGGHTTTRDFQTKAAAEHRADLCRGAAIPINSDEPLDAATSVTITVSDPITWPAP